MPPSLPPPPLSPRTWLQWPGIGMAWLAGRLPWGVQRALGRGIGALLPMLLRRRHAVARRNLEVCFPELDEPARARLLRESYASLGIGLFEFARAWWGSVAPMQRTVRVEGLEHLARARESGRGIILIS